MMCIVLSIYIYTYTTTQLNIDDDVKSSVKKRKKERGECIVSGRGKIQVLLVVSVLRPEYILRTIDS